MTYRKKTRGSHAPLIVCRGLLRLFLSVTITASVLFLASCGSAKTAARAEVKRQANTEVDVRQGISLDLTGGQAGEESPELVIPIEAIAALPEDAEYSRQEGDTRVSARRTKGDSVRIRATSRKAPVPELHLQAGMSDRVAVADTTESRADGRAEPAPAADQNSGESRTVNLLLFLILVAIVYGIVRKDKSD